MTGLWVDLLGRGWELVVAGFLLIVGAAIWVGTGDEYSGAAVDREWVECDECGGSGRDAIGNRCVHCWGSGEVEVVHDEEDDEEDDTAAWDRGHDEWVDRAVGL